MSKIIQIEVAYATPTKQQIIKLELIEAITIEAAIHQSGILQLFPEIDLTKQKVGIFSKSRFLTDMVTQGDRIEIYRPLSADPKEARRTKAKQIARQARQNRQARQERQKNRTK